MKVDAANVYFDHPYHAQLDHALGIDFVNEAAGSPERVVVELSAESARPASGANSGCSGKRAGGPCD